MSNHVSVVQKINGFLAYKMQSLTVKVSVFFVLAWIIFSVSFALGTYNQLLNQQQWAIAHTAERIALDLPRLNIANPVLQNQGDESAVKSYLTQLNQQLIEYEYPIRVLQLDQLIVPSEQPIEQVKLLHSPEQTIKVGFSFVPIKWFDVLGWLPLFAALLFTAFYFPHCLYQQTRQAKQQVSQKAVVIKPRLVINLHNKTLGLEQSDITAPLANKPLCFYLALIDYCTLYPEAVLNQNKPIPEELLALALTYFQRLVALGHTIRKRPNFANSLEKTLSEIRAALDEVLTEHNELKPRFYPPKAHGEGSRSRLHHYGLNQITADDIHVIGK